MAWNNFTDAQIRDKPRDSTSARALTHDLDKSEQIKGEVAECADELSAVNAASKGELDQPPAQAGLADALT